MTQTLGITLPYTKAIRMISQNYNFMNEDISTGSLLDKKAAVKMLRDMQDSTDKIL
jgi:hypothetical protein